RVLPESRTAESFLFLDGTPSREIHDLAYERRLTILSQSEGDLGHRLRSAFAALRSRGAERVVAIGTDTPHLDPDLVVNAFEALGTHDLVIGPAEDGGYYLIGMREPADGMFESIAWSTPTVLDSTLERARALGHSVEMLPRSYDIDDAGTLLRAAREHGSRLPGLQEMARLLER
ncbi:MAG TPA: TIGR04282 family arsenosugar biosynthesis glycosyltransferase, partial [Candidatus Eisenbacteria bacterium]|nr:TIGR04282 family arsenosugar biosynthesis glycosyltransferase [Candidatus Eisenbacteria bacterium]